MFKKLLFCVVVLLVYSFVGVPQTHAQTCSNTPSSSNTLTSTFSVPETNTYAVWTRLLAPDATNNSVYLQIDGGCAINVGDSSSIPANTFTWVDYKDGTSASKILVNLAPGNHTMTLTEREGGVGVDSVIVTTNTSCVPTGTGTNCSVLTATPTPALSASIGVSPSSSASAKVGQTFPVNVYVNGGGTAFNAAQATVAVSSNLTITSLASPSATPCNFSYAGQTPSTANPSFAGAILAGSSTSCNVYKLNITPNAAGTGTITFTNGSVKSYANNSEILSAVQNGTYTLTIAVPTSTPVPTPTNAPTPTATPVPTATPIPTATPTPTAIPTATPTPTAAPTPTTAPSLAAPTVTSSTSATYQASYILSGAMQAAITEVYVNGSKTSMTYPTSTTWSQLVALVQGTNTFTIYGKDANGVQSSTRSVSIVRNKLSDINGDNTVTLTDISLFSLDWLKTSNLTNKLSDMNEDGIVNLTDFSILAKQYGT